MKFIHIADIHASRERLPQTLSILNTLIERCKKKDIDFIIFAGDFWDSTITATKGSGFTDIISAMRELEKTVRRIFMIYGTPSHEPNGSLDAFKSDIIQVTKTMQYCSCIDYGIIAIPEPRRSEYIGKSAKEIDETINSEISHFLFNQKDRKKTSCKDKPLILVYHGEVKGALYQNGVKASSATAIPAESLKSLKADYYAFGHIHMPQELWENAWYSGSACPKNFGETHDGCYNLVTITEGETSVERVSFGLPVFETYQVFFGDFTKTKADFSNKHIRLQFDCTKEEKKSLNIKQLCDEIRKNTNALSVKLEPSVIESENTEKSKVVTHKSIVEKMVEYAKERALIIPKGAKELLQQIQDNTLVKLAYPQHSFELLSLSLRGAIGIRDGQHKEDFEINFEQYEDGVICLTGPCGHGKSTLIENCHPYPQMLSREGALKDHFYLKDSHRILIYRDENGLYYRISMLIDGKNQSGKVSYFVATSKNREIWDSVPDVDGSYEDYKKWVNSTFGSIDIFLRTAFFAKEKTKDATDISDTTKSERMELLSKLAGTDHLKEVVKTVRDIRKEADRDKEQLISEIDSYSHFEDEIKKNKETIFCGTSLLKSKEEEIKKCEKEVAVLKVKDAEFQKNKAVADANKKLKEQYEKELNEKRTRYADFEECSNNKDIYDNVDKCNKSLEVIVPKLDELAKLSDKKNKTLSELNESIIDIEKQYYKATSLLDKQTDKLTLLKSQIQKLDGVCPTCGSPLSEKKKKEIEQQNGKIQDEFDKLSAQRITTDKEVTDLKHKIISAESKQDFLSAEIKKIDKEAESLADERNENVSYIQKLNQLYIEWTYDEVVKESEKLEKEIESLELKLSEISNIESAEDVTEQLSKAESNLKSKIEILTELKADIKVAKKENERYEKQLDLIKDKKNELKKLDEKIAACNFIDDAFSNNGIPAIELRESAPEIADIANKILSDSYGNKFEIRFGSTSELKTNRKANEDFNILVYDTENGDEKTIDLVSSGERIWLKQALFYAFSIVQMNRTGFNFRTRLIDESDGSLDGGLRPKYLKMVTAAHAIASARITVLITHSQEIKDIAQQIIEI